MEWNDDGKKLLHDEKKNWKHEKWKLEGTDTVICTLIALWLK